MWLIFTFWGPGHIFGVDEARFFKFGLQIERKEYWHYTWGAFKVTWPLKILGNKCYCLRNGARQTYSYNGRLTGNHVSYWMAPISMTLSDPEMSLQPFLTHIHQWIWCVLSMLCVYIDGKVSIVFNRNCVPKNDKLLKVRCPTSSHIHCNSGSVKEMARDTHCHYTPPIGGIIWPIYSCHFQWPWMTLKVMCLMQDLSNAIRRTFMRHLARV